jgi:hypothetical protein
MLMFLKSKIKNNLVFLHNQKQILKSKFHLKKDKICAKLFAGAFVDLRPTKYYDLFSCSTPEIKLGPFFRMKYILQDFLQLPIFMLLYPHITPKFKDHFVKEFL